MHALIKDNYDANQLILKKVPIPSPNINEVLVKIHYAGICGTDLKIFEGKYHSFQAPIVMGHEFSGVIEKLGSEVKNLSVGDNVVARTIKESCGNCEMCIQGRENLCKSKKRIGFDSDGVFSDYVVLNHKTIHKLPENISLFKAAFLEPIAVVMHGLKRVQVKPTSEILIIGPGPIGLICLIILKQLGANVTITGIKKDEDRLNLGLELGANKVVYSDSLDPNTSEYDIVIDCSGTESGINYGLAHCKYAGQYLQVGTRSSFVNIDFMKLAYQEIIATGCIGHVEQDWVDSIKFLSENDLPLEKLIDSTYSLKDWEQAFSKAIDGEEIKVIFSF